MFGNNSDEVEKNDKDEEKSNEEELKVINSMKKSPTAVNIEKSTEPDDPFDEEDLDSEKLIVDFDELSRKQKNQIKRIKKVSNNAHAISIFYYNKAGKWKYIYWIGAVLSIVLAGTSTIINVFYDTCSGNTNTREINVVLSALITVSFAIITLLNSAERRKNYDNAGDKYSQLSANLYREVFYSNDPIKELYLESIIYRYQTAIDNYIEMFPQPPLEAVDKILKSNKFGITIKFKQ